MKHTCYFRDASTGLDYADQRYEQPGVGRFMSPDPAGSSANASDPGSWNRYAYVGGDPANGTDSSGLNADFENGYGGGFSFYLDGLQVGGGMFGGLMDMGAAAICPNNACSGFVSDSSGTTLVQFQSEAGAGSQGYVGLADTLVTPTADDQNKAQQQTISNAATDTLNSTDLLTSSQVSNIVGSLTPGPVVGGHQNLQITQPDLNTAIGDPVTAALIWNAASSPFGVDLGTGLRDSNFTNSLHISVDLTNGLMNFHIDTFNNSAMFPVGTLMHGLYDWTLGRIPGICLDEYCP